MSSSPCHSCTEFQLPVWHGKNINLIFTKKTSAGYLYALFQIAEHLAMMLCFSLWVPPPRKQEFACLMHMAGGPHSTSQASHTNPWTVQTGLPHFEQTHKDFLKVFSQGTLNISLNAICPTNLIRPFIVAAMTLCLRYPFIMAQGCRHNSSNFSINLQVMSNTLGCPAVQVFKHNST